jgi:putative peptidoglycan lipid II flippase
VTQRASGRTLARAGLIVTAAFLASRILGWIRLAVIGTTFGAGADLDSFYAAFRIPDFIFQLVAAGALSSALIPVLAGLNARGEDVRAWRVASTVANLMMALLLALAAAVWLAAPVLVPAITPGFDEARIERTVELTRIMLASPVFLALGALATSLLNARGRFAASAVAPLIYNAAIIGGAVFLAPTMGVTGLALGVVAGAIGHFAVQLAPLRAIGFRYRPAVELGDPDARSALLLMVPRAFGLAASQLTFIVATTLASGLAVGSLAAFSIAFNVFQIPFGVIGVSMGVVALPALSAELARGDIARYLDLVTRGLRLVVFVMLPLTAMGMVLHVQVIQVLFGYGRFDDEAIDRTATALLILLLALPSESLIAILARAFYAGRDTTTPVVAAVLAVAINTIVAVLTVGALGLRGIALGIVLGSIAEASFLTVQLARRVAGFDPLAIVRALVPAGFSALGGAVVTGLVVTATLAVVGGTGRAGTLVALIVATAAGGLVYLGLGRALRIGELETVLGLARSAVRRSERPG